jgi:hypothetical protein
VKVTFVPTQIEEPALDAIETAGVTVALVKVITLLVAVGVDKHGAALDVITTEIAFPFAGDAKVYVGESVPTFEPFNFHW